MTDIGLPGGVNASMFTTILTQSTSVIDEATDGRTNIIATAHIG